MDRAGIRRSVHPNPLTTLAAALQPIQRDNDGHTRLLTLRRVRYATRNRRLKPPSNVDRTRDWAGNDENLAREKCKESMLAQATLLPSWKPTHERRYSPDVRTDVIVTRHRA